MQLAMRSRSVDHSVVWLIAMGGFGSPGFDVERNVEDAQRLLAARGTEAGDAFRSLRAVREGNVFAIDANRYFARPSPSLAVRRLVSLPFPPC